MNDYSIIGGGPVGLSLALILGLNNKNVTLIEREKQLGGTWKLQWVDNEYFSEHAPRVLHNGLSDNHFFQLLNYLNLNNKKEVAYVYGNIFQCNIKLLKFFISYMTVNDFITLLYFSVKYKFVDSSLTVKQWLNKYNISKGGRKALSIMAVTISDRPDKLKIVDLIGSASGIGAFYQLKNPNKWIDHIEKILKNMPNVVIYKNYSLVQINTESNLVSELVIYNKERHQYKRINSDRYILAVEPSSLINIIYNSNFQIKNNWKNFIWIKKWCSDSYYIGFGFQLNFKEKIKFPDDWCWSCRGDWNVIITPISEWVNVFSKDAAIKTTWSCCIVDMDTKSTRLNKTPNECSKEEIIDECLYQINRVYKIKPDKITVTPGLYKKNGVWMSENTAFSRTDMGYIPMKGKIDNLFYISSGNDVGMKTVTTIDRSLMSAHKYLKKYDNTIKPIVFKENNTYLLFIAVLFAYLSYRKYQ